MAVIDASTVIAAVSPDEDAESAYAIMRQAIAGRCCSPALWLYECANAFQTKHRRGILDAATRDELIDVVMSFGIVLFPPDHERMQSFIVPLAAKHGLSVHDASYLDLARQLGEPLATRDRRLGDAAAAEGITLLG